MLAVLAVLPYRLFDLDRFFVPKELILHIFAMAMAISVLWRADEINIEPADMALGAYLILSALGAIAAPDIWLAGRALALTFSGAAIFWALRASGSETRRTFIAAAAAAAVIAASASLAQAYGFTNHLFSINRIPGGTMGNRNFVAHIAAVCAPALLFTAIRAKSRLQTVIWTAGIMMITAVLVLTRCRAALLGLAAGGSVMIYGLWRLRSATPLIRMKILLGAAALGLLCAVTLPNKLSWKSDSPYIDTVTRIAEYKSGSGHSRIMQYTRSLRMTADHPFLGVGTGNWALVYPKYMKRQDGSIDRNTGRALNPWPSSDWIAVLSERGIPAFLSLILVFLLILKNIYDTEKAAGERRLEGYTLAAVLISGAVVACFDAFLLLPASSFLFWGMAGALVPPGIKKLSFSLSRKTSRLLACVTFILFCAAILRSSEQITAMAVYTGADSRSDIEKAASLDPGNARIKARLKSISRRRKHKRKAVQPIPVEKSTDVAVTETVPENGTEQPAYTPAENDAGAYAPEPPAAGQDEAASTEK